MFTLRFELCYTNKIFNLKGVTALKQKRDFFKKLLNKIGLPIIISFVLLLILIISPDYVATGEVRQLGCSFTRITPTYTITTTPTTTVVPSATILPSKEETQITFLPAIINDATDCSIFSGVYDPKNMGYL